MPFPSTPSELFETVPNGTPWRAYAKSQRFFVAGINDSMFMCGETNSESEIYAESADASAALLNCTFEDKAGKQESWSTATPKLEWPKSKKNQYRRCLNKQPVALGTAIHFMKALEQWCYKQDESFDPFVQQEGIGGKSFRLCVVPAFHYIENLNLDDLKDLNGKLRDQGKEQKKFWNQTLVPSVGDRLIYDLASVKTATEDTCIKALDAIMRLDPAFPGAVSEDQGQLKTFQKSMQARCRAIQDGRTPYSGRIGSSGWQLIDR